MPKKSDITVEQFHVHYRTRHGPIAMGISPIMRTLVQVNRMDLELPGLPPAAEIFRGVSCSTMNTLEDAAAIWTEEVVVTALSPDEKRFLNGEPQGVGTDIQIVKQGETHDRDRPAVHAVIYLNRTAGRSFEEAEVLFSGWAKELAALPGVSHAEFGVCLPEMRNGPPTPLGDAVIELWWKQIPHFEDTVQSPAFADIVARMREQLDLTKTVAFVGEDIRQRWVAASL